MTYREHNVELKETLNPWLLPLTVVHLWYVLHTVTGNQILYGPFKNHRIILLSAQCETSVKVEHAVITYDRGERHTSALTCDR